MSKPVRVTDLIEKKENKEKITMLTAYDATMAGLLEQAGIDVLLVGDSVGMVLLGYETTLPVTLDVMIHHTAAVVRGVRRTLVVADLPFMSYQVSLEEAVRNAGRLVQQGGAAAVKLEGGRSQLAVVRRLVEIGIPVMGHLGLTPQSVHVLGGFRRQGTTAEAADRLTADALALEEAGVFALVLESIPASLARRVTETLAVPTIGIGAGPHCDGQVLVVNDILGLFEKQVPPFVKQYANLAEVIRQAAARYCQEVRDGQFPKQEVTAEIPEGRAQRQ